MAKNFRVKVLIEARPIFEGVVSAGKEWTVAAKAIKQAIDSGRYKGRARKFSLNMDRI